MKICSNCGATNKEDESAICRKCGALLPIKSSSRNRRIMLPKAEKEISRKIPQVQSNKINEKAQTTTKKIISSNPQVQFFAPEEKLPRETKNQQSLDLYEIPIPEDIQIEPTKKKPELSQIPPIDSIKTLKPITPDEIILENNRPVTGSRLMEEITPQPFAGSIMQKPTIKTLPNSKPKKKVKEKKEISNNKNRKARPAVKSLQPITPEKKTKNQDKKTHLLPQQELTTDGAQGTLQIEKIKRNNLEEDMRNVLKFLSTKIGTPKIEQAKQKLTKGETIDKKIPPKDMSEILSSLLSIDNFIEAAAIIKTTGTILAAAISNRVSDSLFVTIGQNLTMIGTDIIHGLSAGELQSISVRGTNGVLDIAPLGYDKKTPLVKDMILVIFSHPKVKSGVISFAVNTLKKQLLEFLEKNSEE